MLPVFRRLFDRRCGLGDLDDQNIVCLTERGALSLRQLHGVC